MKMEAKKPVIEIIDDDDGDESVYFLAAAEADVLASKRRRITPPSSNTAVGSKPLAIDNKNNENDGLYMAALKGDHIIARPSTRNDYVSGGGGGGGRGGGHFGNFGSGDPSIAEKNCPCGLGICLVLTANTERNRGRKFYKCPLRQENGGCGFFEWCDSSASGANNSVSMAGGGNHGGDGSSYPALDCPCGAGSCLIFTAKTGKNIGQQFYRCPSNQGSSCGFFKWCNDNTQPPRPPISGSKAVYNSTDSNNTSYTARTGSSCFKCGKEGHWARDCSAPSSNPQLQIDGRSASSGSCYKCGKPGHWSRDCTLA